MALTHGGGGRVWVEDRQDREHNSDGSGIPIFCGSDLSANSTDPYLDISSAKHFRKPEAYTDDTPDRILEDQTLLVSLAHKDFRSTIFDPHPVAIEKLPINQLILDEDESYGSDTREAFEQFKTSIRNGMAHGIIEEIIAPVIVQKQAKNKFLVIDGARRVKACREVAKEQGPSDCWGLIPAKVIKKPDVIIIGPDVVSISPKDDRKADLNYLMYALSTNLVNGQVRDILKAKPSSRSMLSVSDLGSIVIYLPKSLNEQKLIWKEQKQAQLKLKKSSDDFWRLSAQHSEARKTSLRDKEKRGKESVGHIIHSLAPKLSEIDSVLGSVLARGNEKNGFSQKPLQDAHSVEDKPETVGAALESALKASNWIREWMKTWETLAKKEMNPKDFEKVDMDSVFKEIKSEYRRPKNTLHFRINYSIASNTPAIELHRQIFKEVINNIIRNAEKSGVFKEDSEANEVNFSVGMRGDRICIDYWNNGKEFPKEITESKYLSLGDPNMASGGGGYGGALLGLFMDAHGGEFKIVRDTKYPVHHRLFLPIIDHGFAEEPPEKYALSVSAADTNYLIKEYAIHSCPDTEKYSYKKTKYITFRMPPTGAMNVIYEIKKFLVLSKQEVDTLLQKRNGDHLYNYDLNEKEIERLVSYALKNPFRETNNRFYILSQWKLLRKGFMPSSNINKPQYYSIDQLLGSDQRRN